MMSKRMRRDEYQETRAWVSGAVYDVERARGPLEYGTRMGMSLNTLRLMADALVLATALDDTLCRILRTLDEEWSS